MLPQVNLNNKLSLFNLSQPASQLQVAGWNILNAPPTSYICSSDRPLLSPQLAAAASSFKVWPHLNSRRVNQAYHSGASVMRDARRVLAAFANFAMAVIGLSSHSSSLELHLSVSLSELSSSFTCCQPSRRSTDG